MYNYSPCTFISLCFPPKTRCMASFSLGQLQYETSELNCDLLVHCFSQRLSVWTRGSTSHLHSQVKDAKTQMTEQ